MTANILFLGGSLNQTTMMHKIAQQLGGYNCYFTPFYSDGSIGVLAKAGLLDYTILGGRRRQETLAYLEKHRLPMDLEGKTRTYDMVVIGTDLVIPRNVRSTRLVMVQEGITEPEGWAFPLVKKFKLPLFLANTAATGLSDAYDIFCVASFGYRDLFASKGVKPEKMVVTGIPNFDSMQSFYENDFPHRDFVLVATTPLRESLRPDDRIGFIKFARRVAAGRKLIFKLHPGENVRRASWEIHRHAPEALILTKGDVNAMIANCQVLITQTSTVTFVGLALGKEVHSYLNLKALQKLVPIQNGGTSAVRIAGICERVLHTPLAELKGAGRPVRSRPKWLEADGI